MDFLSTSGNTDANINDVWINDLVNEQSQMSAKFLNEKFTPNFISQNVNKIISLAVLENFKIKEIDLELVEAVNQRALLQDEIFEYIDKNVEEMDSINHSHPRLQELQEKILEKELDFYLVKEKIDAASMQLGLKAGSPQFKALFSHYYKKNVFETLKVNKELIKTVDIKDKIENLILSEQKHGADFDRIKYIFDEKKRTERKIIELQSRIKDIKNQEAFFFSDKQPKYTEMKDRILLFNCEFQRFTNIFNERLFLVYSASLEVMEGDFGDERYMEFVSKDVALKKEYSEAKAKCFEVAKELDEAGYIANATEEIQILAEKEDFFLI